MKELNNLFNKILSSHFFILLFFIFTGIALSNFLRFEVIADFYNYHYFVPWAFFHQRTFVDVALAMENSYHNPLIEIPAYFIINNFNEFPFVLYTFHGILFGILIFVFYKLVITHFNLQSLLGKVQIFATIVLVFGGFSLINQIGTSSNEITVSIGVIFSLYIVYRELFVLKKERCVTFFISGFILGGILGLKLTAVTYCLAFGGTLILFFKYFKHPFRIIIIFTIGGFSGFCVTHGYWSYLLWKNMENPLFPYLNNLFKSPFYADKFLSYTNFYEKTLSDYLTFPFLASFQKDVRITSESYMVDVRLALGYTLLIIVLLYNTIRGTLYTKIKENKKTVFLVTFTLLSYIVWLYLFSIIRYAIPIEMLISLFIVQYFTSIRVKSLYGFICFSSLCIVIIFTLFSGLPYKSWGDRRNDNKIIDFEKVTFPQNTLVLALSPCTSLAATQIIPDNPTILFANETSSFTLPGEYFYRQIEQYKQKSDYIAYIVALKTAVREFDKNTPIQSVKNDNMEEVFSNLQYIIKTELGKENFYCRAVNKTHNSYKIFICIDKKDKFKIFSETH